MPRRKISPAYISRLEKKFKSQKALADYLQISTRSLRHYKAGTRKPSQKTETRFRTAQKIKKKQIGLYSAPSVNSFKETSHFTYLFKEPKSVGKAEKAIPHIIKANPKYQSIYGRLFYNEEDSDEIQSLQTDIWSVDSWEEVISELLTLFKQYAIIVEYVEIVFRAIND